MAMTASESPATVSEVVLGVDTHLEMHVAVALDGLGRRLGELAVSTTTKGYEKLICWAQSFGTVGCAGVEGTGSYGAGLTRYLRAAGISVVEVERPSVGICGATASPTLLMRRLRLGRCLPTI